jgi:hypothetical protein
MALSLGAATALGDIAHSRFVPMESIVFAPDVTGADRHRRAELPIDTHNYLAGPVGLDVGIDSARCTEVRGVRRIVGGVST